MNYHDGVLDLSGCPRDVHDLVGNLTSARDQNNSTATISEITTVFNRAHLPDLITQVAANMPTVNLDYDYDSRHNRTITRVSLGGALDHTNVYSYDALNRVTQYQQARESGATGTTPIGPKSLKVHYYASGQPKTIYRHETAVAGSPSASKSSTDYSYRNDGRPTDIKHYGVPTWNGSAWVYPGQVFYNWTYDAAGRVDVFTIDGITTNNTVTPDLVTTDYDYDAFGQVTRITATRTGQQTSVVEFPYGPNGNRNAERYGTGPYNRTTQAPDGSTAVQYDYDAEGNRIAERRFGVEQVFDDSTAGVFTTHLMMSSVSGYGNDHWRGEPAEASAIWRFTTLMLVPGETYRMDVTWPAPSQGTPNTARARYELFGDNAASLVVLEVNQNESPGDYSYEGVSWRSSITFTVNQNVQAPQLHVWKPDANDTKFVLADAVIIRRVESSTEYQWDYRNRLVHVDERGPEGQLQSTVDFRYDVFDRRTAKIVDPDAGGPQLPKSTYFVNDAAQVALELDAEQRITRRNLWAQAVDQLMATEALTYEGGTPSLGNIVWPLADHQGTVRELFGFRDSVYKVFEHLEYDGFGRPLDNALNPLTQVTIPYLYTGQYYDVETGLQYSRARYYDPVTAKFISEDPLSFAAGDTNLYRRVGNSPVNATDPSGMSAWDSFVIGVGNTVNWIDDNTGGWFGWGIDQTDRTAAGFSNVVTFGYSNEWRESLYGDIATRNHQGWAYNVGTGLGVVHSLLLGYGAGARLAVGAGRATTMATYAARGHLLAGDAAGIYQSATALYNGNFQWSDTVGFLPTVGWAARGLSAARSIRHAETVVPKGSFGGIVGNTAGEARFLRNAAATFGDSSVFSSARRFSDNIIIQRSDIPFSVQNVRSMAAGRSPFVKNRLGEWEKLNLHHVGRQDGTLIEVLESHNAYNSVTGGPLHIPGAGGPVRDQTLSSRYWMQRLQDAIDAGVVPQNTLHRVGL